MQKKLIALAVAGLSSAAFAQSSVTISGNIDLGYNNFNTQTAAAGKDTQQSWAGNGSSTSMLVFQGTESLGNGLTAGFFLESDFTAGAQQQATAAPAAATPFSNQFLNSQNYLSLAGSFGDLKFGNMNNASLGVSSTSQPFGTAIGSAYSGAFARLSRYGNAGNLVSAAVPVAEGGAGTRLVRSGQSAMYTTPTFNGFSGSFVHVFKNDNDQYNSIGQQELGLKYGNGPLNVAYSYTKLSGGSNIPAGGLVSEDVKHNMLGANYSFGAFTVYGGWTSSKGNNAAGTTADARSWNIAGKWQATSAIAVMANIVRVDDKLVGNQDRNLNGLGLDYALSKRTTAYVRYENGDNDKSAAAGNAGAFTRWALGARHSF